VIHRNRSYCPNPTLCMMMMMMMMMNFVPELRIVNLEIDIPNVKSSINILASHSKFFFVKYMSFLTVLELKVIS
jgi:hypothetical protein